MKKIIAIALAVLLAFSCSAVAFAATEEVTPVLVISGMGAFPICDEDSGEQVFGPSAETIIKTVLKAAPSLAAAALLNKWEIFGEYGAQPIHDLFEKMRCDENGDSVYNLAAKSFPENAGNYDDFKEGDVGERAVVRAVAEKIGWENTYMFYYDFRRSALDIADDLNETVKKVLSDTGSEKLNIIAMSFGGTVTSAYLYKYGSDSLKNVVYASTAVCGTDIVGEMYSGNFEIALDSILDYLEEYLVSSSAAYELVGLGSAALNKYGSAAKTAIDAYLNAMIETLKDPVYSKVFMDTFARFPGVWGLINAKYYEKAKEFLVPYASLSDEFIKKTDEYAYNVEMKNEELIAEAEANGVNVYMVGAYGYSGIPLTNGASNQTDSLIDTYLMTGYATVSKYGKTLSESDYIRDAVCTDKSHNHISTDGTIDASTCFVPERTWFVKNMGHVEFGYGQDSGKLLVWIATSENGVDVNSDSRYPQFVELNRNSGKCTSLTEDVTIPVSSDEKTEKSFLEKLGELLALLFRFLCSVISKG